MDKDPLIAVRSTVRGKNSKGGDRLTLYISQEVAGELLAVLSQLKDETRGVKLDIHTNKKEYEGRSFDSSFFFVKAVQEGRAGSSAGGAPAPTRFKPKAPVA